MVQTGEIIQELRKDRGWNQKQLADRLGVGIPQVSRMETGETKSIGDDTLVKIAGIFQVSADYLLGLSRVSIPKNQDISKLGLSETSIKRLLSGQISHDVLNRLMEHDVFPTLMRQISSYFDRTTASVLDARNEAISHAVEMASGIREAAGVDRKAVNTVIRQLNVSKVPPDEVDLRIIQSSFMKIIKDIRSDIQSDVPASTAITSQVFENLKVDIAAPEPVLSEDAVLSIIQNAVEDAPFSSEQKELMLDFFQRFSKLNQQQDPSQNAGANGETE